MTSQQATTTLWRPTGPKELELVRELAWLAWPPRLPEQPIFYPVLNEDYAIKIARDWNVRHDGAGFVTQFEVESDFLRRYPVQQAGGQTILELWGYQLRSLRSSTLTSSARSSWFTSSTELRRLPDVSGPPRCESPRDWHSIEAVLGRAVHRAEYVD